jgi:hypothetical protein
MIVIVKTEERRPVAVSYFDVTEDEAASTDRLPFKQKSYCIFDRQEKVSLARFEVVTALEKYELSAGPTIQHHAAEGWNGQRELYKGKLL